MPASNTPACFEEFINQKMVGVLYDALPVNRRDLAAGTKTLIFEDGRGLTITSSGAYWIDAAEEVNRAIVQLHEELQRTKARIANVLKVAGVVQ